MVINSKKELRSILNYERLRWKYRPIISWLGWLKADLRILFRTGSPYWYMYCLRMVEYYQTRHSFCGVLLFKVYYYRMVKIKQHTGIEIWPGVAERGVTVNHGKCVVSKYSVIGEDSVILSDVTLGGIGGLRDDLGAPKLGKRVFVGSGSRIIGPVHIADNVVIGANSVVVKDISEPGITVAGAPARKISDSGSENYIPKIEYEY